MSSKRRIHTVGIAGLGAVGFEVARRIDAGGVDGLILSAVSARDHAGARERMAGFRTPADVVAAGELAARADVVVPSGAVMGLDAVRGAAESGIDSVTMVTRKPPDGLVGAPYLADHGIDVEGLDAPLKVFEGSAREGARGFPANVNVAAALGLAGIGPERTRLEIWADPGVTRNTHEIRLEAETVRFQLRIENVPSPENPRTGRSVAPSVIAALRRFVAPLVVGT